MSKIVCVVDDQPNLRRMLHFALSDQGVKVLEAENGVDALDKLSGCHVDMVVVDWQMPRMGGLELVRHLRKMDKYAELPILVISCMDNLEARQEAMSLGVLYWLKKPFRIAELQLIVENSLGLASQTSKKKVE